MEKKIERVPYISKWYKEELDWSQLFKFDFKDEPMTEEIAKELNDCFKNTHVYFDAGSDWDVDKFSLYDKNLYTYSTNTTNGLWTTEYSKPKIQLKYDLTCAIQKYIENIDDIINKKQRQQLERLEKQYQPNQKLYCTLVEHWKELMDLFEVKNSYGMHYIKMFVNYNLSAEVKEVFKKLTKVENSVGMYFIKDFIKACEKCED